MKGSSTLVLLCVVTVATITKTTTGIDIHGGLFIFGDSLLDVGTNNHFDDSSARADHPHYGIDYPDSVSTGRFSNGLNSADLLASYMKGYDFSPPPFLTLVESPDTFLLQIIRGANFASGGSGILRDTGREKFRRVVPLWDQIQQFATVRGNMSDVLGNGTADFFIGMSHCIISVGSNDFFEKQNSLFRNETQPQQLIANLTATYAIHLQNLYDLGARKFGIIGVPPLGCCPKERYINYQMGGNGSCVEAMNELAQAFHASIESLLQNFSSINQGVVYSLGNTYNIIMDFIDNRRASGFQVVETACCGNGTFNAETGCESGSKLCRNRNHYIFWDEFHPTEAAARHAALTLAYADGQEFVTPMNFSSLAKA
uniref:Uncharacterized protein n=2 Tax=Lactuca sativa TaxID=4236 RepID=A0A9R1XM52_LACSA|nr:hypothetical protein LSAT_V11C300128940 [Lactuca sativa]